ncbi:hypothetical protein [Serinicoccus sp. LYQ131]|uniref:hypothetical protein n=1 Tax=Serinicoccus sp. LYQ131 TaxID=3378797 RepID=UPI003852CE34
MKKPPFHHRVRPRTHHQHVRDQMLARGERGSISVETVVIALGLFALATLIIGLLTVWATGQLGGLN